MVVLVATEKDILIVWKIPTDGSDDTAITEEAEYNISFIEQQNKLSLSVNCNGSNSILYIDVKISEAKYI